MTHQIEHFDFLVVGLQCWRHIKYSRTSRMDVFDGSVLRKSNYRKCPGLCVKLVYDKWNSEYELYCLKCGIAQRYSFVEFCFFLPKELRVTHRFCAKDQDDLIKQCNVRGNVSCDVCSTDGCNSAVKYNGQITFFAVIPMIIVKIFQT